MHHIVVELKDLYKLDDEEEYRYFFNETQYERLQKGLELDRKKDKIDVEAYSAEFGFSKAIGFPHMFFKYTRQEKKRDGWSQKNFEKRPTNIKNILKKMNVQVSGEHVIDERKK